MDLLSTAIQEAQYYYQFHKEVKSYVKFTNFLESLKRDNNKALIENIEKGISVILENVASAVAKKNPQYSSWLKDGRKLVSKDNIDGQSIIKKAQENPTDKKNTMVLLTSVFPIMAKYVDEAMGIWDIYNAKGVDAGDETAIEAMSRLTAYVLEELIPKYDHKLGNKFFTYVASHLRPASKKGGNVARDQVKDILDITDIREWVPESKRSDGSKYAYTQSNKGGMVKKGRVRYKGKVYTRLGPDQYIPSGLGELPPDDEKVLDKYWIEAPAEDASSFRTSKLVDSDKAEESGSSNIGKIDSALPKTPEEEFSVGDTEKRLQEIVGSSGIKDPKMVAYLTDFYVYTMKHGKKPDNEDNIEMAQKNGIDPNDKNTRVYMSKARKQVEENLHKILN